MSVMRKSNVEKINLKMLENELVLANADQIKGGFRSKPIREDAIAKPSLVDRGGTPIRAGNGAPGARNPNTVITVRK